MSARDELHRAIAREYTEPERDALIDAFAHELAERQRDERPQYNPDWTCWGAAADLIDPAPDAQPDPRSTT